MWEPGDKAREEFFAEARELLDGLSKSLLALDVLEREGRFDAEPLNEAFRAIHTLKGLAGLFIANPGFVALTNHVEDLLDGLRVGRARLSQDVLDLLFRAGDELGHALDAELGGGDAVVSTSLSKSLADCALAQGNERPSLLAHGLEPELLAVLTEQEEHRLQSCLAAGLELLRLRIELPLATLDRQLEELRHRAKLCAEVITTLPAASSADPEAIALEVFLASAAGVEVLKSALGDLGGELSVVEQRRPALAPRAAGAPGRSDGSTSLARPSGEPPGSLVEVGDSLRAPTRTVRVDIRRLDRLMNIVGELGMVRTALSRIAEDRRGGVAGTWSPSTAGELHRLQRSFERRLAELQEGILDVRMVPLGQVFERLSRVVRQLGRQLDKELRLVITGAETELDKLLVEELSDPLLHMVRNAIDHGIEPSEGRSAAGKPAVGTIALNAFQRGNHVVIEIEDDGAGIDTAELVERAVQAGKLGRQSANELAREDALRLVFVPGLSTRDAGGLSGRGVGMDVVKTNIARLGGVIDVQSRLGVGTKVTVTLPITLAIVRALMVRVGEETYALPLTSVSEAVPFESGTTRVLDGREVISFRGGIMPFCRVAQLFGVTSRGRRQYVVVAHAGAQRFGLLVDALLGQADVVLKPLGPSLNHVRGFVGATELEGRRVALVLDTGALFEACVRSPVETFPWAEASGG